MNRQWWRGGGHRRQRICRSIDHATRFDQLRYPRQWRPPNVGVNASGNPLGDALTYWLADINIFSDQAATPNVTVQSGNLLDVTFSSIERALFTPGSGVVNVLGDNNFTANQGDTFVVTGADVDGNPLDGGVREFNLQINGGNPIGFNEVVLNVRGGNLADALYITPFADNTSRSGNRRRLRRRLASTRRPMC